MDDCDQFVTGGQFQKFQSLRPVKNEVVTGPDLGLWGPLGSLSCGSPDIILKWKLYTV